MIEIQDQSFELYIFKIINIKRNFVFKLNFNLSSEI